MRGKGHIKRDFDFYIDEYLYYCQSRRLRPKTMNSYEQTLRLFERWTREQESLESLRKCGSRQYAITSAICRTGANTASTQTKNAQVQIVPTAAEISGSL